MSNFLTMSQSLKYKNMVEIQVSVCHSCMVHQNSPVVHNKVFLQVISWHMQIHLSKLQALLYSVEKRSFKLCGNSIKVAVYLEEVFQVSLLAWRARVRPVSVILLTEWSCLAGGSTQTRIPLVAGRVKDTPRKQNFKCSHWAQKPLRSTKPKLCWSQELALFAIQ